MATAIVHHSGFPKMLVSQLVRDQAFMEKAVMSLEHSDFFKEEEKMYQLMYIVLKEWWESNRIPITKDVLVLQLETRLSGDPMFLSESEREEMFSLIDSIFDNYKPTTTSYMTNQLSLFLQDRRIRTAAAELSAADLGDEFVNRLKDLAKAQSTATVSSGKVVDIFRPESMVITSQPRITTGIPVLDSILGGGRRPGEVYGLTAPSGGGKTTLAVQAFVECAKTKHHTAYLTYETDVTPELSNRMYSYMAGLSRKDIENKDMASMSPGHVAKIKEALQTYGQYMHAVDMKTGADVGTGGATEVAAQLREFHNKGTHIDLVVIDQYLPMIDRYLAARNMNIENRRIVMQSMVQEFMDIAQPSNLNCTILLVHQTGTVAAAQPPWKEPNLMDSAECKSFPFWMTNCIALGTLDPNNICWITSTKARNTARSQYAIKLNGEYNRFEYEKFYQSDRYVMNGRAKAFTDLATHNTTGVVATSTISANRQNTLSKYLP